MSTVPWTKAEQERIVHTFAFDEAAVADYMGKISGLGMMCQSNICLPVFCLNPLLFGFCFLKWGKENGEEISHCMYLALSKEGIMYCMKAHKNYCQLGCQDSGEEKKFIPYEKILDVKTISPAGGCVVKETLHRVEVQTAANSGQVNLPELVLEGLVDPEDFVEKVRELTRQQKYGNAARAQEPGQMEMGHTNEN